MSFPSSMADFVSCDCLLQKAYSSSAHTRLRANPRVLPFFIKKMGKFPWMETQKLSKCPGVGSKKEGKCPDPGIVAFQHFFINQCSEKTVNCLVFYYTGI